MAGRRDTPGLGVQVRHIPVCVSPLPVSPVTYYPQPADPGPASGCQCPVIILLMNLNEPLPALAWLPWMLPACASVQRDCWGGPVVQTSNGVRH